MDFTKELTSKKKDEEKESTEVVDGETGEVLERAKIVENHELALTFPRLREPGFSALTLEEKAYVYAVHKAAEKILGDRLKAMNEAIKAQMTEEKTVKAEFTDVRVVHDVPGEPEPVKSLDIDRLAKALDTDHMGLVEMGLATATMIVKLKSEEDVRERIADPAGLNLDTANALAEAVEAATVVTTPEPRSDRIIVTALGTLKSTLADIKRKALPQKSRKEWSGGRRA